MVVCVLVVLIVGGLWLGGLAAQYIIYSYTLKNVSIWMAVAIGCGFNLVGQIAGVRGALVIAWFVTFLLRAVEVLPTDAFRSVS